MRRQGGAGLGGEKMSAAFDLILLAVLIVFVVSGFRRGFVRSLLELAGYLLALVASAAYSGILAEKLVPLVSKVKQVDPLGRVVIRILSAVLIFVVLQVLVHLLAAVADGLFRLPVLHQVNALLGGVLGFAKGCLVLLLVCTVTRIFLPAAEAVKPGGSVQQIGGSRIYQYTYAHNPVYALFQTDLWSEVNKNGKKE